MSTANDDIANQILNYSGGKAYVRGQVKRLHRATVNLQGADIDVEYLVHGSFLPATETDPAEFPECDIRTVEIGHQDVTLLLRDTSLMEAIAAAVEAGWRREAL